MNMYNFKAKMSQQKTYYSLAKTGYRLGVCHVDFIGIGWFELWGMGRQWELQNEKFLPTVGLKPSSTSRLVGAYYMYYKFEHDIIFENFPILGKMPLNSQFSPHEPCSQKKWEKALMLKDHEDICITQVKGFETDRRTVSNWLVNKVLFSLTFAKARSQINVNHNMYIQ